MDQGRWLIVHADDFGISNQVNRAIMKACDEGIVTTVGIVANGAEVDEACQYARGQERVAVGLHINMTEGRPLLPAAQVPSLVDRDGRFYSKNAFIAHVLRGRLVADQLRAELSAQAERLTAMRLRISHVNSHHHIHALPAMAKIVAGWSREAGIRYVRSISMPSLLTWRLGGWRAYAQQWLTALSMRAAARPYSAFCGARRFWGFELAMSKNKQETLRQIIQQLPEGVHELMCHPKFFLGQKADVVDDETSALCDPQLRQLIVSKSITLLSTQQWVAMS